MSGTDPLLVPEADLPLLLVHGEVVWWTLLSVGALAGAALAAALARVVARRRRRAAMTALREQLIAPDSLRAGARVALRGRLVGPPGSAAVSVRLDGREQASGPRRAENTARAHPGLEIEIEGALRVALEGPVCVVAGAEVTAGRGRDSDLIAPLHDDAHALAQQVPWTQGPATAGSVGVLFTEIHRIPIGGVVVAEGELALGAARSDTGYRDAAQRWSMVGSEDAPIQLGSEIPGLPRWGASRWQLGVCLGAALAFVSLWSTGRLCLKMAGRYSSESSQPVVLRASDPLVIASAMPGARTRALDRILFELDGDRHRDGRTVAQLAALTDLVRGCRAEVQVWRDHGQYERAAARAAECGEWSRAADALGELGDYAAAADRAARHMAGGGFPDRAGLIALIASGRRAEAARAAQLLRASHARRRAQLAGVGGRHGRTGELAELARLTTFHDCLARHLQVRAGDPGGLAALAILSRGAAGRVCGPLYADLLTGPALIDFAASWRVLPAPTADRQLRIDAELPRAMETLELLAGARPASWRRIGDAPADALGRPDVTGLELAIRLARPLAAALAARPERTPLEEAALADLRAAATGLDGLALPRQTPRPALSVAGVDPADVERAMARAMAGDGRELAGLLQQHRSSGAESALMAVAPGLRSGREALAEYLTWREDELEVELDPCSRLLRAVTLRDLMAWLGQPAQSARWAGIARGQQAACTARESAVALWMLRAL
ncbi:MAG TPA: hypothetical protein VNO33_06880 [Kofleriaceae bacterium]|nr:hypothetical protein [Kofleriaceae bacterium]